MARQKRRGKLIVFEGIDGAGTTTQVARTAEWLGRAGRLTHETREPSDGPIGVIIRQILGGRLVSKQPGGGPERVDPATVALLYAADRLDHIQNEIEPHLAAGRHVLCDRYVLSSLAYQTIDCDVKFVRAINDKALTPDFTIFVRVRADVAMARIAATRPDRDIFETLPFQRKVAAAYDRLVSEWPATRKAGQLLELDGELSVDAVATRIRNALEPVLL